MLKNPLVISSLLVALWACSPKVDNSGYVRREEPAKAVTAGMGREDVLMKLGSPSSQSTFGEERWYYITNRKESLAFLPYEVAEQDVASILFDADGKVVKVENYTLEDAQEFELVQRETPTEGHSLGFFEQILGNIGRFNSPGQNGPSNNRSGPPPAGR